MSNSQVLCCKYTTVLATTSQYTRNISSTYIKLLLGVITSEESHNPGYENSVTSIIYDSPTYPQYFELVLVHDCLLSE